MSAYPADYLPFYPAADWAPGDLPTPEPTPAPKLVRQLIGGTWRAMRLVPAKPGAANTGIPGTYTGLTPSASLTVTTPGAIIDGLDISGAVTIAADYVTLLRSRARGIKSAGSYTVLWSPVGGRPPIGFRAIDSEIDGNGTDGADVGPYPSGWAQSAAIQPGLGYELLRCNIHGHTDGLKPQDNPAGSSILIDRCWVHDLTSYYSAAGAITHNDVLQIAGTGAHDVTIRGCFLDGYRPGDPNIESRYASSSLMQWGSFPGNAGVLRNILIEDNWVDGGGFASRLDFNSVATLENVVLRRNRYGLHHRFGALRDLDVLALNGGYPILEGNVWDTTGTTDFGLAVTAGQAIL